MKNMTLIIPNTKLILLFIITTILLCTNSVGADFERRDVTFDSEGLKCFGWYYVPKNLNQNEKRPAIVMAHGLSAVKEMSLDPFASRFAEAGFIVLVFDYRYLGASEGTPRGQMFYYDQIEDYRNAVTWVSSQREVDSARIGIWGTSLSGGHVLTLSALDKRVKAVVAQVPFTGVEDMQSSIISFSSSSAKNRKDEYLKSTANYMRVVDSTGSALLPQKESYEWFTKTAKLKAPNWKNEITIESLEKVIEYNPRFYIPMIAPTPLLMIISNNDIVTPTKNQQAAFELAKEPKKLIIVQGGHFDAYQGTSFERFCQPAVDWFKQYLNVK